MKRYKRPWPRRERGLIYLFALFALLSILAWCSPGGATFSLCSALFIERDKHVALWHYYSS